MSDNLVIKMGRYIFDESVEKTVELLLILFGLFLLFQIIRNMLGGSWSTEDIIIGLLIFNLGGLFTIGIIAAQLRSDHDHLKNQFGSLANDFKSHLQRRQKR